MTKLKLSWLLIIAKYIMIAYSLMLIVVKSVLSAKTLKLIVGKYLMPHIINVNCSTKYNGRKYMY